MCENIYVITYVRNRARCFEIWLFWIIRAKSLIYILSILSFHFIQGKIHAIAQKNCLLLSYNPTHANHGYRLRLSIRRVHGVVVSSRTLRLAL